MATELSYTRVNWQDAPNRQTPLSSNNLNVMDEAIADLVAYCTELEERITALEEATANIEGTGQEGVL